MIRSRVTGSALPLSIVVSVCRSAHFSNTIRTVANKSNSRGNFHFLWTRMASSKAHQMISTEAAPAAIGPYNQAVAVSASSRMVYCSGQIGLDPATGNMVSGGVEPEASQALANMSEVLKASGSCFANIVKTTIFLADMADYAAVNKIYAAKFEGASVYPARSVVAAAGLPRGARFEIDAIAIAEQSA